MKGRYLEGYTFQGFPDGIPYNGIAAGAVNRYLFVYPFAGILTPMGFIHVEVLIFVSAIEENRLPRTA